MKKMVFGVKPERGLLRHWYFWICVLLPILGSIGLATWFGLFNLKFLPTLEGVENFYERGKFFLAMSALAIPLGATFSRMHSSEQNAELINTSKLRREEDKLNDLLGNYLGFLKDYHGRFYGYRDDFEFKSSMVSQPIKIFHYLIASKRGQGGEGYEVNMLKEARKSISERLTVADCWESVNRKQKTVIDLCKWIEKESQGLGFDFDAEWHASEIDKKIGRFFHRDATFDKNQSPDFKLHGDMINKMSRFLRGMSACYYYSSQVFFLYDYNYAKNIEAMAYETSCLSYLLNNLVQEINIYNEDERIRSGTQKLIFNRGVSYHDAHEIYEVCGDLESEGENIKAIVTTWYRL